MRRSMSVRERNVCQPVLGGAWYAHFWREDGCVSALTMENLNSMGVAAEANMLALRTIHREIRIGSDLLLTAEPPQHS